MTLPPFAGEIRDSVHHLPIRIYYEDTDFSGFVYHGNYVRFLERGRSDYLRCLGIAHERFLELEEPLAFTIQRLELKFHAPAHIDELLEVQTVYVAAKGARLNARQRILRDGKLLLSAEVDAASMNLAGRPRRLPPEFMEPLNRVLRPEFPA